MNKALPAQQTVRECQRRRQAAVAAVARHRHCHASRGAGHQRVGLVSNEAPAGPDVVLGCAGDVPTLEIMATVTLLREHLPRWCIRVVNVVDLTRLQPETEHPHGLNDAEFDALFTRDWPIVFAFHGYPWLMHRLAYRRHNHANLHVRGYQEEGTTTTPFDMTVLNDLDRYHLMMDVIDRVPMLAGAPDAVAARERCVRQLGKRRADVNEHGKDLPEIRNWCWRQPA
jgi:xylulose-5-phosphate/fructose-6-phosphate phosphoketolase